MSAIGAVYFMDSPRSDSVWAEALAVDVRTSATRVISEASRPKARSVAAAMLVDSARSVPVARDRFMTEAMEASISLAANPARPSSNIAEPTCAAVNEVVRPRNLAFSVRRSNSSPVAPVTALTDSMTSSKSL